ncbi:MAG: alpha-1,2-fucosyltransferase [Aurantimicrobium sp.]|uniref:alpha-1,2-fucosyltransferase n=1 Tax=Aurantimicrobium sp. TaxID=1930784 RepID=UPI002FC95560
MKTNNGITGYIAGGLGNQLFILAASWEQSHRLGCPLFLNTSYLEVSGLRELELNQIDHPGIDIGSRGPWTSKKFPGNHIYPFPRSPKAVTGKLYFEKDQAKYDSKIHVVRPGTQLIGYFQSARYFPTIAPQLHSLIEQSPLPPAEADYLDSLSERSCITLHLRRGDYQAEVNSGSVIASVDYARRAIALLRNLGNSDPIRVFSDSPEYIAQELGDLNEDIEIVDNSRLISGIGTIRAMSLGSALIMSNSSFSWWAGWLMEQRLPEKATVISPRPWNESGTARADMLYPTWMTLDARPHQLPS